MRIQQQVNYGDLTPEKMEDLDVVVDGVQFVRRDKAQAQIDALTVALGNAHTELQEEREHAKQMETEADDEFNRAEKAVAVLHRVHEALGPAAEPHVRYDYDHAEFDRNIAAGRGVRTDAPQRVMPEPEVQAPEKVKRPWWTRLISGWWLLVIGVFIGGSLVPYHNDRPALEPNYAACIGQARYNAPLPDNQYQELVNALYTCEVYP